MMAAAWDHNPQEVYHSAAGIAWGAWLAIGIGWFLALWLPLMVLAIGIWFAARRGRVQIEPPAV
jgi:hypothetical protein